eukprot:Colp12_sorted_trinity150504_noHs@35693
MITENAASAIAVPAGNTYQSLRVSKMSRQNSSASSAPATTSFLSTLENDTTCIERFLKVRDLQAEQFTTSWLIKANTLFHIRCFILAYISCVLVGNWVLFTEGAKYVFYFTRLNYMAQFVYFLNAVANSATYTKTPGHYVERHRGRLRKWYKLFTWVLYETQATFHIVVPLMYWLFLSDFFFQYNPAEKWIDLSVHGLDFVFLYVDVVLNRMEFIFSHAVFVIFFALIYILWMWFGHFVIWKAQDWWPYDIFDWSEEGVYYYYIGTGFGVFLLYCSLWGLHKAKGRLRNRTGEVLFTEDNEVKGLLW